MIHELIRHQALQNGDKLAIKHNGNYITYADLEANSNKLAAYFNNIGIGCGDIIAIVMDRSIEMSVCMLAMLKIGATYMPIDPNLPVDRIDYLLKDSTATKIIYSKKFRDISSTVKGIDFDDAWINLSNYTEKYLPILDAKDVSAYIIYTSGSTGDPKGVSIYHKSLLNLLLYRRRVMEINQDDNILGITNMSFDIAQEELYLPLISGALLTIADKEIARDGSALLDIIRSDKITFMQATPYIWHMMIESGWKEHFPIRAISGGEALSADLAEKLLKRCNEVWNMYGPTETTVCATAKKITAPGDITIGRPIDNVRVYILDEKLRKLEAGEEGEIFIAGDGVAKGYINRPDLTKERFIDDVYGASGQKMYKTGDLGRVLPNNEIQFIGRIDTQIKFRGYRIETEEIEYKLKQYENIKSAVVTVFHGPLKDALLVAYVLLKIQVNDDDLSHWINEIKEDLKRKLPGHMVPTSIVVIPNMPLLPSGKIDIKALPPPNLESGHHDAAPTSELEKTLIEIWKKNIGVNNIDVNDDFFDLGGTSLIAVKTKIQIENTTKKRLSPSILFKYPTIKKLATIIADSSIEQNKALVPIKPEGSKMPLYIVHGIGLNVLNFRNLAYSLDIDQPVFGLKAVVLEEQDKPLNTIESIASFYIDEILNNDNTATTFAIAGYSIGGVIAYEMAKQLKARGKKVAMLVMFDTAVQIPTHQFPLAKKIIVKSLRQINKLKFRLGSFIKYPKENINYLKTIYIKKYKELFYNIKDSYGLPEYMENTIAHLKAAFNLYKIEPLDIEIYMFAGKKVYYLDDPKFLGWKKYALRGVKVHNLSSNHDNMFEPPYNKEIAQVLQQKLNEINCQTDDC